MKNKKTIFIILGIIVFLGVGTITSVIIYQKYFKVYPMNLSFDVDVYSDKTLFDYKDDVACNLEENKEIDTKKVGNTQITTTCRDNDKKRYKYIIDFNIVDKVAPKIILKDSFTVTEGYTKNLTDVIISVDNYDDIPKREIIGEYDFNKVGSYNLVYKVTDNSGNFTTKDFTLNVVPKKNSTPSNSYIAFSDALRDYKTENTEVGIDVSKWQGEIDFKKVKEAGAEFVMIRIGHQDGFNGEYITDPYFESNIENAKENGLKVGVYFYSYANSNEEAKKQVAWVTDNLKDKDYKLDLPIVYDWESWSSFNSMNVSLYKFNEIANTFLEEIEKNNYEPMLYSSKNYLENIWDKQKHKVWLAHYTNKTNYQGEYYIWQMCSDGRIDGIKGDVDIDILYK